MQLEDADGIIEGLRQRGLTSFMVRTLCMTCCACCDQLAAISLLFSEEQWHRRHAAHICPSPAPSAVQSGMDNVRNITGSPIAGIDPHELIDTRPLCHGARRSQAVSFQGMCCIQRLAWHWLAWGCYACCTMLGLALSALMQCQIAARQQPSPPRIPTRPCAALNDAITSQGAGNAALTNLPRKINIGISSSRDDFAHCHINDVGLKVSGWVACCAGALTVRGHMTGGRGQASHSSRGVRSCA